MNGFQKKFLPVGFGGQDFKDFDLVFNSDRCPGAGVRMHGTDKSFNFFRRPGPVDLSGLVSEFWAESGFGFVLRMGRNLTVKIKGKLIKEKAGTDFKKASSQVF